MDDFVCSYSSSPISLQRQGYKSLPVSPGKQERKFRRRAQSNTYKESKYVFKEVVENNFSLREEIQSLHESLKKKDEQFEYIKEKLLEMKVQNDQIEDENTELRYNVEIQKYNLENASVELEKYEACCEELKKRERQISVLGKQIRSVRINNEEFVNQAETLRSENNTLKEQADEKNREIAELKKLLYEQTVENEKINVLEREKAKTKYYNMKSELKCQLSQLEKYVESETLRHCEEMEAKNLSLALAQQKNELLESRLSESQCTVKEMEQQQEMILSENIEIRNRKNVAIEDIRRDEMKKCLKFLEEGITRRKPKEDKGLEDNKNKNGSVLNYRQVYLELLRDKTKGPRRKTEKGKREENVNNPSNEEDVKKPKKIVRVRRRKQVKVKVVRKKKRKVKRRIRSSDNDENGEKPKDDQDDKSEDEKEKKNILDDKKGNEDESDERKGGDLDEEDSSVPVLKKTFLFFSSII